MTQTARTDTATGGDAPARAPDCVIVFGSLRSGTTMLRLMLDGHPALSCIGETDHLLDHISETADGWRYDTEALRQDRIFRGGGLRFPEAADGRAALYDLIRQIGARHAGRPVLMLHRWMEKCARLLPDAKVIRLLRDPRDVARSAVNMGWAGNVHYGAETWIRTERSWRAFEAAHPGADVFKLRYEDLVCEPEARLADLCAFLSLDYDPEMLAYARSSTYGPPDGALAYQWKSKLSERQRALVEARVGDLLEGSGYAPSGAAARRPGTAEAAWLAMQNRSGVWRDLIRRYGLLDPIARGVGRRLGLKSLHVAAARRIDDKTIKFLK